MGKGYTDSAETRQVSFLMEYGLLFKFKLTSFVVFSAMMAYLVSMNGHIEWVPFLILFIGGFCVTAAANTLNEVLEKDYDKLMKRTANRPVAAGRMSASHAVFVAGMMWIFGIICLSYFNVLAAFLGSLAVVTYAFIYTPLKRYSPIAVFVGSFPGALPLLIGNVAAIGHINQMGIYLFAIQFIWQFPHFWAIGWLGYDEYKKAGYKLVASKDDQCDPNIGINSAIYALMIVPLAIFGYYASLIGITAMSVTIIASIIFAYFGYNLYKSGSKKSALNLMFASLFFLFIALGAVYIDKLF